MKLVKRPFKQNARVHIEVVPKTQNGNGELWVELTLLKSRRWRPALEELDAILRAIGYCEDRKYPNGKGRLMTLDFLQESLWAETPFEALRDKYQIPIRTDNHHPGAAPAEDIT